MTRALVLLFALTGCSDGGVTVDRARYQPIFDAVDRSRLEQHLQATAHERYTAAGKARFRDYFVSHFQSLGLAVEEQSFTRQAPAPDESEGHNLEAVLPGRLADSVVLIAHYDSMGVAGMEADNPAVDDDMSGMAVLLEAATVLASRAGKLEHTVRFVAVDLEELPQPPFEGSHQYVTTLLERARRDGFTVPASIDHEQSGWSGASGGTFDVSTCTSEPGEPEAMPLGDLLVETARSLLSPLAAERICLYGSSDNEALEEGGIPSVMFLEQSAVENDHFDGAGGDTLDRVDLDYLFHIAQVAVAFDAEQAGLQ